MRLLLLACFALQHSALAVKYLRSASSVTVAAQHDADALQPDFEQRLWAGEDVEVSGASASSLSQVAVANNQTGGRSSQLQRVQLFGLFNTGTNLVYQLLQRNFPGKVSIPEKVWKHVSPRRYFDRVPEAREQFEHDGTVAVAVVRDPLSWLQSVHKAPYNLEKCTKQSSWLTEPCPFTSPIWHPPHGIAFKDIEEYWNQNTADYDRLSDFGFSRSLVIRYEDVVLDTEGVMAKLGSLLQLDAPAAGSLQQVDGPAKDGGSCLGRQQAIDKLKSKGYLKLYHDSEKQEACQRLDAELTFEHGYVDCSTDGS